MKEAMAYSVLRLVGFLVCLITTAVAVFQTLHSFGVRASVARLAPVLERLGPEAGLDPANLVGSLVKWQLVSLGAVFGLGVIVFVWAPWLANWFVHPHHRSRGAERGAPGGPAGRGA